MSQWYSVEWPPQQLHPSLPAAIEIVQNYLFNKCGVIARDEVAFAASVMLGAFRKGEKRHLALANTAIVALDANAAKKAKAQEPLHLAS